eukprot:CAMPEP_0113512856 /NCGR_PEP_ID=MMETSP0014_2-20120614/39554_1 /TAXON_ID=2857 /ORGANISM="Nitzschia sp." /LENGTH=450 /DNA_ID=CAMNT_0000409225 /DNA_START=131 /DNA_END=1483 /DNA_ORIENTATION=+ /assembly_acc=CAM_ASM_000159
MDPTIVERSPKPASSRRASKRGKHHDIDKDFLRSNLPRQPSGDRDVDFFYMADGTNPATSSSSFSAAAAQPTAPNSYRSTHSTPAPSSYRSSTSSTSKVAANRSFSSSSGATVTTTNTNTKPINKKNSGILRSTTTPATANMDEYYTRRSHGHDIEAAGGDGVVLSVSGGTATTGSSSTAESSKLGVDPSQKQQQQQQQQQQKKMMLEKDPPPQVLFDGDTESAQEEEDYFSMREDIYSLIILSRTCSASYFFSIYVWFIKIALFSILAMGMEPKGNTALWTDDILIRVAQFVLIPVAVAMQEDLIHAYYQFANVRYDENVETIFPTARKWKWTFSCLLRAFDGLFSLAINFMVLMTTDEALSIFLNFAALQFLQSIDDVAFTLADQGFFGDRMEKNCCKVRRVKFPRLEGSTLTSSLDSILYGVTCLALFGVYAYVFVVAEDERAKLEV